MEHCTWASLDQEVLNERIWRKVITGDKAMVAQVYLAKGVVVPEHQHVDLARETAPRMITTSLVFCNRNSLH